MEPSLRSIMIPATARDEVRAAVRSLYADLQMQIELWRPQCAMSGRCCRFEEFGHRLYVTTLELATFWHDLSVQGSHFKLQEVPGGCPFQKDKLCTVHVIRPFGCRLFFCGGSTGQWQNPLYEQFHGRLKRLHEVLGVPYRYMEWREALRELGSEP